MHLKALTLASPLPGGGVGWDRGKQQQTEVFICLCWMGGWWNQCRHQFRGWSQGYVTAFSDWWAKRSVPAWRTQQDSVTVTHLAHSTLRFWRTDYLCTRLGFLSALTLHQQGFERNALISFFTSGNLNFWTLPMFNQIWPDSVPLIPYYARISDIKDIGEVIKSNFLKTTHVP